jgi:NMD protein affecting ribosome stability and mRNA decay
MICPKCGSEIIKTVRTPYADHICVKCANARENRIHQEKCEYCGDAIYYGQHSCRGETNYIKATLQKSAQTLWNSVTDILQQSDIDRLESIHRKDLENLGII